MAKECQLPSLCIGDFNEISSVWEKQGGTVVNSKRIANFQSIILECALTDLEFKGNAFTWTNNQSGDANIRERIDKAMANVAWRKKFPKAQVFHDVILGSDHCSLILNLRVSLKRIPKLFKFKAMWFTHPSCKDIIHSSWNEHTLWSRMFKLTQKLKTCSGKLTN
ncbi:hypothetical protein Vadar_028837 [Vaccinium darrowii]|uniref:Uncharacterized protein n=1 Tax=Vaccinium darrowii TaxID=229202 RepID=A0ACB7YHY6_9ERIC|nr:hypothetical protein Vadar_028837 [Vaccinium darrowii]